MILLNEISNKIESKDEISSIINILLKFYNISPNKLIISSLQDYGDYDFDRNIIYIDNKIKSKKELIITVLHEIKHVMQLKEYFKGNSQKFADDFELELNKTVQKGKNIKYNKYDIEAENWAVSEYNKR